MSPPKDTCLGLISDTTNLKKWKKQIPVTSFHLSSGTTSGLLPKVLLCLYFLPSSYYFFLSCAVCDVGKTSTKAVLKSVCSFSAGADFQRDSESLESNDLNQ